MIFIIIILGIILLESCIKNHIDAKWPDKKEKIILNGKIILNKYHNHGAMLNLLQNHKKILFGIVSTIYAVLLFMFAAIFIKKYSWNKKLGMSLILAGGASNLYDRIKRGYVVDYFSFAKVKRIVFNISDFCIFIGSILLFIMDIFSHKTNAN